MVFHLAGHGLEEGLLPVGIFCPIAGLIILKVDDFGNTAREVDKSIRQVAAVQHFIGAMQSGNITEY